MATTRHIAVRWTQVGFHRWPEAPPRRDYLTSRHRHLFYFELVAPVEHNDRFIEFHDLLDFAREVITDKELGRQSCEDLAETVIDAVAADLDRQGVAPRELACTCWEDNEVGATVVKTP